MHSSHTAGPVKGNGQSSPKVHQIRSSSALQCLLPSGIFRGALDTQGKENNREEQSFDFMSGGEMEEQRWRICFSSGLQNLHSTGGKKKKASTPNSQFISRLCSMC